MKFGRYSCYDRSVASRLLTLLNYPERPYLVAVPQRFQEKAWGYWDMIRPTSEKMEPRMAERDERRLAVWRGGHGAGGIDNAATESASAAASWEAKSMPC